MTITEWFEKAKEEGYEWADKAIEYRKQELCNQKDTNDEPQKLSEAVFSGFIWGRTKEGQQYWVDIAAKLMRLKK
jgi:hypothetical protein